MRGRNMEYAKGSCDAFAEESGLPMTMLCNYQIVQGSLELLLPV